MTKAIEKDHIFKRLGIFQLSASGTLLAFCDVFFLFFLYNSNFLCHWFQIKQQSAQCPAKEFMVRFISLGSYNQWLEMMSPPG